jgi:hypothetical protein
MNSYYSNIYWHFTGSPENSNWRMHKAPEDIIRDKQIKSDKKAWEIAIKIIESKTLLGSCEEMITDNLVTDKFCCLTDIPIQNLRDHCTYYGNVCIGFNCVKIHAQFNPVLYLKRSLLPHSVKGGPLALGLFAQAVIDPKNLLKASGLINLLSNSISVDERQLNKHFINHLKLTNFSPDNGKSFYREREWRHIGNFTFEHADIACIIVPQVLLEPTYEWLKKLDIKKASVASWELLKEI